MAQLHYFDQIHPVMVESGRRVMQYFKSDISVFEKNKDTSLVSNVDLENEQFLKLKLAEIMPQAGFFAEESGIEQVSDWMWVIDAIDGTRNFIKGLPHFCIMIALTYKNEPMMSAIYQPVTQELYYAEKGKGLWLQGVERIVFLDRLQVTKTGIIVCSQDQDYKQARLQLKLRNLQASRRYFGCAGLDAIYLIQGNIDLMILKNIDWWDVAAGMLCIAEAGGLQYQYHRLFKNQFKGDFYAGNSIFFEDFDDKDKQNL